MTSNGSGGMSVEGVEATLFREKLCNEEPKMDAAIKSYCSWLLAKQHQTLLVKQQQLDKDEDYVVTTHIQQHSWEMAEVLVLARKLSKSINAHVFDIRLDESTERSIVAQVWNEVAAMSTTKNSNSNIKSSAAGVRITKMLGQTALIYAWKEFDRSDLLPANNNKVQVVQVDDEQQQQKQQEHHETARLFLETFEQFLFANNTTVEAATAAADSSLSCCTTSSTLFNDAQLIWSPDGGKQELSRRATQRQKVALERRQEEEESSQRLRGLLQLQQQQAMIGSGSSGSSSSATAAASTPTITIIEEAEEEKKAKKLLRGPKIRILMKHATVRAESC